ncbi:RNA-binding S4 domain-containing protein [Thalassobius vesicularis]|uniref:RNA-binding S4 domain-containing protein n=1 Tax=Thalassobius vesicularis TaxID=1294297 RepID=A0A4S3M8U8_9RHOB|nr:RNA-binding S4 domain-containing protein [Thalassobius vesicularis]THD73295.1 RNA-binding S4 domain-containing protein [Thalassobius vesicularis]
MSEPVAKLRVDKWLWFARFYKTRGLASTMVNGGHIRVNGNKIAKASHSIGPGDVLTLPQGNQIRVVRVLELGTRRGPAPEAQTLYADLTEVKDAVPPAPRYEGKGRPTKRDRRMIDLIAPEGQGELE